MVTSVTLRSDVAIEIPAVEDSALTFAKTSVTEVRVTVPDSSLYVLMRSASSLLTTSVTVISELERITSLEEVIELSVNKPFKFCSSVVIKLSGTVA